VSAEARPRIVLATGNPDKARELARLLPGADVDVAPDGFDPEETGTTLFQNALIKAEALRAEQPEETALADDSGLVVHALGGRPGVYSSRYAGPGATYADNCAKLLDELGAAEERSAAFVSVLVALRGEGMLVASGSCPGAIATAPRGSGGFGYDPVFIPLGDDRSMAEMSAEEKAAVSHRGRAARRIASLLGLGPAGASAGPAAA
jgi:XTP/dITP diphosphohydrolase